MSNQQAPITLPIFTDRTPVENANLYLLERLDSEGEAISTVQEHVKLTLSNDNGIVTNSGTPLNAENMNLIVDGIRVLEARTQNFDALNQITNDHNTNVNSHTDIQNQLRGEANVAVSTEITSHNSAPNAHEAIIDAHDNHSGAHSVAIGNHDGNPGAHSAIITNHDSNVNAHESIRNLIANHADENSTNKHNNIQNLLKQYADDAVGVHDSSGLHTALVDSLQNHTASAIDSHNSVTTAHNIDLQIEQAVSGVVSLIDGLDNRFQEAKSAARDYKKAVAREQADRVADIESLWAYLNFEDLYTRLLDDGWIFTPGEFFDIHYEAMGGRMPEFIIERYEIGKGVGIVEMPIPTKPFCVFLGWRLGDATLNDIPRTQIGILYLVAQWGIAPGFSENSDGYIDGFMRTLPGADLPANADPAGEQGLGYNLYNSAPCPATTADNGGWTMIQNTEGVRLNTLVAGLENSNSNLGMSWANLTLTDGNIRTGIAIKHIALSPTILAHIQAGYSAKITVSASFISGGRRIVPTGLLNARRLEAESMICTVAGRNYTNVWDNATQSSQVKVDIPNGRSFPDAVTASGTVSSTIIMNSSNINDFLTVIWRFWTRSTAGGQNSNGDAWTRITGMNINWEVI
ncbi:MAG: hypothetical protein FWD49_04130 [Firmicutes bacterium]|nr:hypothetical protein [Bacillota bacterium]